MITITRKIQINIANADKKAAWKRLYEYQNIVHKAANLISTHQFCMDRIKDFLYLTEDVKYKLANSAEEESGILTSSKTHTTYRLCSSIYKSKIPMSIISCLNLSIVKTYNKEHSDYYLGKKSLRSYRNNIPIPISTQGISFFEYDELKKNYRINIYDFEFLTFLGKDKSGNKTIIDRCLAGEYVEKDGTVLKYKMCNSAIQIKTGFEKEIQKDNSEKFIKRTRAYLLFTCQFDSKELHLDEKKICEAELSVEEPVILKFKKNKWVIGSKEDYLYKRLQIQNKLYRLQKSLKHNKGGHGRKLKLQALEQFKEKENNYIDNKLHNYSRQIINYCIKNNCGTLKIIDIDNKLNDLKNEDNKFVLRNWSYYGFLDKIKYKAKMAGLNLILPEEKKAEKKEPVI